MARAYSCVILANRYDPAFVPPYVSLKLLYRSLGQVQVDRSDTKKGEDPGTPRGPGEPGEVSCIQHENRVTKPTSAQYFTWRSVEVSLTPPPLGPDIGRSSYFT